MIIGIILNILMIVGQAWPTYLYAIVFIIGLTFFSISKWFKNISILGQLIIVSVPFVCYYSYYKINEPSKDIFLIPSNFRGKVAIIYNQKNGANEEYEGNYRIYRIPKNGILKTKFKVKGESWNIGDAKYYFINNDERIPIKQYCLYCEKQKIDTTNVQMIPGEGGNFSNNYESEKTNYLTFYINIPNKKFKPDGKNIFQTLKLE